MASKRPASNGSAVMLVSANIYLAVRFEVLGYKAV
jgi:hypothetical protein